MTLQLGPAEMNLGAYFTDELGTVDAESCSLGFTTRALLTVYRQLAVDLPHELMDFNLPVDLEGIGKFIQVIGLMDDQFLAFGTDQL